MAVFIQIPAILTTIILGLAILIILPVFYQICYENSWWTANGTGSQLHPQSVDQTQCKNTIPIIFMAFVGACAAIAIWVFLKVGQSDQNIS
ncbi:MAG: hypothetical protein KGJ07_00620 [Patescibacteria group bacterium]|nr:hypothetical protein [Patescibacteria group bacterium]